MTTEQKEFVYVGKNDANEQQKAEGMTFYCHCNGGEYDDLGNNIGGPPPRPLDIFQPIIQEGNVYI